MSPCHPKSCGVSFKPLLSRDIFIIYIPGTCECVLFWACFILQKKALSNQSRGQLGFQISVQATIHTHSYDIGSIIASPELKSGHLLSPNEPSIQVGIPQKKLSQKKGGQKKLVTTVTRCDVGTLTSALFMALKL